MPLPSNFLSAACFALLGFSCAHAAAEDAGRRRITPAPELPAPLPWDLGSLSEPPAVAWLDDTAPVRSLLYAGEKFHGRATRVFAEYATPATIGGDHTGRHRRLALPRRGQRDPGTLAPAEPPGRGPRPHGHEAG